MATGAEARVIHWHIITGEYPPQRGGVSDYTRTVAVALARAGDRVHVWAPAASGDGAEDGGVTLHRELGSFAPADLRRVGAALDRYPGPRRLLVQWVPHSYGYRSLNLGVCLWLWMRARRGDRVELMVHEPFLGFRAGAWRHNAAAAVHRIMTMVLLRAASRVWVSAPLWAERWKPYALARRLAFDWLPIQSSVPVRRDPARVASLRAGHGGAAGPLIGHFGTYGADLQALLRRLLPPLLSADPQRRLLLLGRGGPGFRERLLDEDRTLAERIHAPGGLPAEELSVYMQACDLFVQPYPDGVNARRSSTTALLSHGLPVFTTAGRLTEPFWMRSGGVVLCPSEEGAAMVQEVERLLADAERRAVVAAAGRRLYDECFDLGHAIDRLRSADV